jgi:hypothetical protein
MRWLLFLSRLAFICGFFFLLSLSQLIWGWMQDGTILSTIITIGVFMGSLIVPATCICYLFVLILRKKMRSIVPWWLIAVNIFFLLLLIFFIFYWNDPYYNQG